MNQKRRSTDPELGALSRVVRVLDTLSVVERERVLAFIFDRYEFASAGPRPPEDVA